MIFDVNAAECRIVGRSVRLRARVWGLRYESGVWFTRQLAADWRAAGMRGIGLACRDLALELADVPGAYECYAEARSIAFACGVLTPTYAQR